MAINKRDIEFLFEIGSMRNVQRAWRQQFGVDVANNNEHAFRVTFIALILARAEGVKDEEKIMKMALVHDLEESRTADHSRFHKPYININKEKASKEIFEDTSLYNLYEDIIKEYEKRESIESQVVKDADQLDVNFELKELEERGHKIPDKWAESRKSIKDRTFYTNSARELFDLLKDADVSDWYVDIEAGNY